MNRQNQKTVFLIQSSMIAAIYTVITLAISPLSFGANQIRFSEALAVLPVLTPAAIPGLTIGCIISNLGSPNGLIDIIMGSTATLLSAILTSLCRKIKFKNLPLLSMAFPVLFNAVIIGLEITLFLPENAEASGFIPISLSVAFGEFISCYVIGIPLFLALKNTRLFNEVKK